MRSSSSPTASSFSSTSSQYVSANSSPNRAREEDTPMKSAAAAEAKASSSSSSSSSRSFSAKSRSPSTRENTHDGFNSLREEDSRLKSSSSSSFSSSSSSQSSSANRSSSARENTHDLLTSFREDHPHTKSSSPSSSYYYSSFSSASSSSSQPSSANPSPNTSHDVFISFRGEDTRSNFISHLLPALTVRRDIRTYMDCDLQRGNEISSTILRAIEQSKIALIVFSEKYANSSWTLDELEKIMECKKRGQHVIPIFYKVRPTDVRHQTGVYATAFKDLKKRSKVSFNKVQQWTNAMTEAASLAGWDSSVYRSEYDLVEAIASEVKEKLNSMSHGSEGEIQIVCELQAVSLPSQNYSDEPNPGDSQEGSFPSKCLPNRHSLLSYLGEKTREALWRRDNEQLILNGRKPSSISNSPKSYMYSNVHELCIFHVIHWSKPTEAFL